MSNATANVPSFLSSPGAWFDPAEWRDVPLESRRGLELSDALTKVQQAMANGQNSLLVDTSSEFEAGVAIYEYVIRDNFGFFLARYKIMRPDTLGLWVITRMNEDGSLWTAAAQGGDSMSNAMSMVESNVTRASMLSLLDPERGPLPGANHGTVRALQTTHIGRGRELLAVKIALLTRHHLLLVGERGTGKTEFIAECLSQVQGKVFMTKMNRTDTGESLTGGPDMKALIEEGVLRYHAHDNLLDAERVFADEVMDAPPFTLRMLLDALNERMFKNGNEAMPIPLENFFGASNFTGGAEADDILAAFLDRFLLKLRVEPVSQSEIVRRQLSINRGELAWSPAWVTREQLAAEREAVRKVVVDAETAEIIEQVAEEVNLSGRTASECIKLVQAAAYLEGRAVTLPRDTTVIAWTQMDNNVDLERMIRQRAERKAQERAEVEIMESIERDYRTIADSDRLTLARLQSTRRFVREYEGRKFAAKERTDRLANMIGDVRDIATRIRAALDIDF